MPSRLLRRSGVALVNVAELLGWQPDMIIEVGVGQYHEEASVMKAAWPNARLIGFEAHPGIASAAARSYPGEVRNLIIGDMESKNATLFAKHRHKDGSSLYRHRQDHEEETYHEIGGVEMTTLDLVFPLPELLPPRLLLWLDCEGSELLALRGAWRLMPRVAVVNVEVTANPPGVGWARPLEIHEHLSALGFRRQWIHTQRCSAGQYDAIYVRQPLFRPEYCCDPC